MKQRLMLAQAIMEQPELLVLDEPTNALDKDGIRLFKADYTGREGTGCNRAHCKPFVRRFHKFL